MSKFKVGDLVKITDDAARKDYNIHTIHEHGYLWLVVNVSRNYPGKLDRAIELKSIATGRMSHGFWNESEVEKADV